MIDLDELKEKWAEHDRKLDAVLRLNRRLLSANALNRAQSALKRLALGLSVEVIIQLVAVVALGSFIYDHIAAPRFAMPAAALDFGAISILVALVKQIAAAVQIDYDKPVSAIQKQIEALRIERIRLTRWILIMSPLAWTPLLIVALKGLFAVDAYAVFGSGFLLANLLVGLLFIPLSLWLSRKFGERMAHLPTIQRVMYDLAGHNLKVAAGALAAIDRFEDEP